MTAGMSVKEIHQQLAGLSRELDVLGQSFTLSTTWWRREFGESGWTPRGLFAESSPVTVSRQTLFALAPHEDSNDDQILSFAFHVLFWGSGSSRRNNRQRIAAILEPEGREILRSFAVAGKDDPRTLFRLFRPERRNLISYLGPAFFTKLMYFGGNSLEHPSLIVDNRVLKSLHRTEIGRHLPVIHNYGLNTYLEACKVMHEIAEAARQSEEPRLKGCTADVVEYWAFKNA